MSSFPAGIQLGVRFSGDKSMNGGFIKQQQSGEHQIVTFIFSDTLTEAQVVQWNEAIRRLKGLFGTSITGVTQMGENTPDFNDSDWAKGKR
jgi:hypothetical protein